MSSTTTPKEDNPEYQNSETTDEKRECITNGNAQQGSDQSAKEAEDDKNMPTERTEEDEKKYISGMNLWAVMIGVTIATFLMMLDTSILSTAVPRITSDFHSLPDIGWYVAAYQLASATLQPFFGKIYQYFSTKWVYFFAVALFALGSLLCATAVSSRMLIAGRAVAGLGASGLYNGSFMIIAGAVPLARRPALTGILMGISQMGLIIGPLVGGSLTEYASWRWCFYINLPLSGLALVILTFSRVPDQIHKAPALTVLHDKDVWHKLDLTGAVLFAPAIVMLLLALQYGGNQFSWNSATVIGLFCGAGATTIVFLFWERRAASNAMVPLEMIAKRVVLATCLAGQFMFVSILVPSYFLPVYFQSVRGATPFQSGVYLLPSILSQLVWSILCGYMIGKVGYYIPFSIVSAILMAVGSGLISTMSPSTTTGEWIGYQIIHGSGRGWAIQNAIIAIQANLPPSQLSVGMAILIFTQNLSGAIFISIANTIFDNSLRDELTRNAPNVSADAVITAGATAFRNVVSPEYLPEVVLSFTESFDRTFYLALAAAIAIFVASWGMGWKDVRKKKTSAESTRATAEP